MQISRQYYKNLNTANPLLSNVFCADPAGIEYNGRLYIYGTNDQQQFKAVGVNGKNTYERIQSIVCFSTDDMVNWTYHGEIDVKKIAPFILASWAPSVVSRVEKDGLTHFYMYFSNSGCGVGVLTAVNPEGPWSSPLNHPLIDAGMKGLEEVPNPFDPGVCIDDKGDAWIVFGGGVCKNGSDALPGSVRIAKLGSDMISFASDFVEIKAPYFFESSDLNFINGVYVYTFNNNWVERTEWKLDKEPPSACSMAYMTSKTPLISDSWVYEGHYFKNPGEQGLNYSNNHTHFMKYKDKWYIFYHTLTLQENSPVNGGFRSICADELEMDESDLKISLTKGTRQGVPAIKKLNPFEKIMGTTMFTSACMWYENEISGSGEIAAKSTEAGSWILVKNVDFNSGASSLFAEVKGTGSVEVRLDKISSRAAAIFNPSSTYSQLEVNLKDKITGVHDIYFLFSEKDICLKNWYVK